MQIEEENKHGQLLWMLPSGDDNQETDRIMIEKMLVECGRRGYTYIMGSIDENSAFIDLFTESGFSILGWEQVWQYQPQENRPAKRSGIWTKTLESDVQQIEQLRCALLSPGEKFIESAKENEMPQFSLMVNGKVAGYAFAAVRLDQVIITPYLSHAVNEPEAFIFQLLDDHYAGFSSQYVIQESKLHLSASVLSEKCKKVSDRRKRIVKHIAIREMDALSAYNHAANGQKTNIVTPISK